MKIAILLLTCKDTPRRTELTVVWFRILAARVRQYFLDQSGGRRNCEFTVYDWMQLSITSQQWHAAGPAVGDTARSEAASHHGFSQSAFERFVLVIDDQISGSGVTDYKTDTRIAAVSTTPALVAHELGHGFDAHHTQLETPEGPAEYDGLFCVMGREGAKYSFVDSELIRPQLGADASHSDSGPGMCIPSLSQTHWLDTDIHCHRVLPYSGGSLASTFQIHALDGAPPVGSTARIGCFIETSDRFIVEYRHPQSRWDAGLTSRMPSTDGWLVVYRSAAQGPLTALQVGALEVKHGAGLVIDNHPFYLFDGGPLRLWVMAIDRAARTVDVRVERRMGKAPQYFPTEELKDFWRWPIQVQNVVPGDEPVDRISAATARLRDLRRLQRLGGPRVADSMREVVRAEVQNLRDLLARIEL